MNYYINEYSLRGQFCNINEFFDTLRKYTLPVLAKVKSEEGSIIWKKDTLWNCKVCQNCTLREIQPNRNERDPELTKLKLSLREMYWNPPLWSENEINSENVLEYRFDEEYRGKFTVQNCFTEAWKNEGRIISFLHPCYQMDILAFIASVNGEKYTLELDNIYSIKWWEQSPEIKKWIIDDIYLVEVRGKEFEYHPPHFHVSSSDYQAVFHLKTGEFFRGSKEGMPSNFLRDVKRWYEEHKTELEDSWNLLHSPITYKT